MTSLTREVAKEPEQTAVAKLIRRSSAFIAAAFGLMTLFAGGRVLAGIDPGYVVYQPLLIYNTTMGFVYIAAGVLIHRSLRLGRLAAAAIFTLNLLVFAFVGCLYATSDTVAIDSVKAMTLRTGVWCVLFLTITWLDRRAQTVAANS